MQVVLDWRAVSSSPNSASVTLEASHGDCDKEQRPKVNETTELVRITLIVLRPGGECTKGARGWRPVVTLSRPLGRRTLVQGS